MDSLILPHHRRGYKYLALAGALAATIIAGAANAAPSPGSWTSSGNGLANWRDQPNETVINPGNVKDLTPKWVYLTAGDVSATPSVEDGAVYVPDWGGNVSKVNAATGALMWQVNLSTVAGPGVVSRTTPTISGNIVLISTQKGARLIALNKITGAVQWITQVDATPFAILTQSPTVANGVVYQGVASTEEAATAFIPNYPCCFFRGNMNAIDLATGAVLWKTYTTPDTPGYSGAAVWSSSPVVDLARNSLYITTGNNYSVPAAVSACVAANPGSTLCDDPTNLVDAIVSLNLNTGQVRWADKLWSADAWNVACIVTFINPTSCPSPSGPDYDFGQGAMLLKTKIKGKDHDVLVAGQKSGVMWGVNPDDGAVWWGTQAGPGGTLGGLEWGSATDGKRVYFAISNNARLPYAGRPELGTAGSWGAIDPGTGAIVWQTKDPNGNIDPGAVSVANGVVYGGSLESDPTKPTFFGLNAANGDIKWSYASGGSVNSGPAIVDGTVYWGSGYSNFGLGSPNNKLYAFMVR